MSFQIRNLMIRLASDEMEKRITVPPSENEHCLTACCDCRTSQGKDYVCKDRSQREDPYKPGDPEEADKENRTSAEPKGALPELGLLRQQLRQTLSQAG